MCAALLGVLPACSTPTKTTEHEALPPTLRPVPSAEDRAAAAGWGTGTWMDQHRTIVDLAQTRPDIVFLGDSITQSWGGPGRAVSSPAERIWNEHFGAFHAANFGISGDRTQHVLWRLDHGILDAITPRVVVLMIGTNNLAHDPPNDIARGIEAIVDRLSTHEPQATLLLCTIVRGNDPADQLRDRAERVNERIRPLADRPGVRLIDLTDRFYTPAGTADPDLLGGDGVHFKAGGYRAWAEMILPHATERLGDGEE